MFVTLCGSESTNSQKNSVINNTSRMNGITEIINFSRHILV